MKTSLKLALLFCVLLCLGNKNITKTSCVAIKKSSLKTALGKQEFNIDSILNASVIKVLECSKKDSIFYPLGNTVMEEETSRIIAVGRFIDKEKIFAVDISAPENATINFYCYENNKWKNIGCEKSNSDIFKVEFKDYFGDERNEIITQGHFNMNGNYTNDFYYCSKNEDTIKYVGGFFAGVVDYIIDKENKTLKVEYEGSWYMPKRKTIYQWRNEKLIQIKEVVLKLKKADMKHDAQFIEYYENPTLDKDTLVLKFKKTYNENNDKLYNLWEHFFE
jgi:hypothetical protein